MFGVELESAASPSSTATVTTMVHINKVNLEDDNGSTRPTESKVVPLEIGSGDEADQETIGLVSSPNIRQTAVSIRKVNVKQNFMRCIASLAVIIILVVVILLQLNSPISSNEITTYYYPTELFQNVYKSKDFANEQHVIPPYWEDVAEKKRLFQHMNDSGTMIPHLGPCYLPKQRLDWEKLMEENQSMESEASIKYMDGIQRHSDSSKDGLGHDDLSGLCRPGFIIIGAGKCGTSSLYHYLVGHPRVLPAKNKQIHYFKYWTSRPMKWYLSNFPPAKTFLSSGALMTGEASPGYLPYPHVAYILGDWMRSKAGNGEGQQVSSPKLITIVRNPLERSWSSYKYNYRNPLLEQLRNMERANHPRSDEWYMANKVFSFEDLIRAELKQLRICLAPGGPGELGAQELFGTTAWGATLMEQRRREGKTPLVTMDESCYGRRVSKNVPRIQWQNLVEEYPKKIINVPNLHLVQSLIGRSLYVLPLEWWYALYPMRDLYIVCNEDLRYRTNDAMSDVSDFLGLPRFNYTNVTSTGLYNVGGHRGYDTVTEWNETNDYAYDDIPISKELRKEYLDFVEPFNERLFQLTGKRCDW